MQAVKDSNEGKHIARGLKTWVEGGASTIDTLPDNVLLDTFEFYLGKDDPDAGGPRLGNAHNHDHDYDGWQTLVHVCYRWRSIVFASPRRLDLKLFFTPQRSVDSKMLDNWPALPIVIFADKMKIKTVVGALRHHHNRVCKIYYYNWLPRSRDPLLKEFAAIDEPLPALTALELVSFGQNVPVLPDSFLGGSAPRLRLLSLFGIPYPSIGNLLSSTTNLVRLALWHVPYSGYIAPENIVPCLSVLPRLEALILGFRYPRSLAHRASRHPPPLTRVVFPNLTSLGFRSDIEYSEDFLSQIETPTLKRSSFIFFNQLVFDTSLLGHFIPRTETFEKIHRAQVKFSSNAVVVGLWGPEEMAKDKREALRFEITCTPLDWQLSAVAQVLSPFMSTPPALESLEIAVTHENWQVEIEAIQWREFLDLFTSVKKMTLEHEDSVRLVAPALQELAEGGATGVLPALQNLFLETGDWKPSGPVKEAIEQFIATRQVYGHPVTVH